MWGNFITRVVGYFLKKSTLSQGNRNLLTGIILERLDALPLRDIIRVNEEGTLLVKDRSLDFEQAMQLRQSARAVLESIARTLIHTQVMREAIKLGVNTVESERQMIFARAAIWWGEQETILLKILAGEDESRETAP